MLSKMKEKLAGTRASTRPRTDSPLTEAKLDYELVIKHMPPDCSKSALSSILAHFECSIKSIELINDVGSVSYLEHEDEKSMKAEKTAIVIFKSSATQKETEQASALLARMFPSCDSERIRRVSTLSRDQTNVSIYCPVTWQESDLRDHFDKYGTIVDCVVLAKVGMAQAFVRYSEHEEAIAAIQAMHRYVIRDCSGFKLTVEFALRSKLKYNRHRPLSRCSESGASSVYHNQKNVYISGLPRTTTLDDVDKLCRAFGKVQSSKLKSKAGKPLVAFVRFSTGDDADEAISALHGTVWNGSKLAARLADWDVGDARNRDERRHRRGVVTRRPSVTLAPSASPSMEESKSESSLSELASLTVSSRSAASSVPSYNHYYYSEIVGELRAYYAKIDSWMDKIAEVEQRGSPDDLQQLSVEIEYCLEERRRLLADEILKLERMIQNPTTAYACCGIMCSNGIFYPFQDS